jgi:hypothetical protein
VKISIILIALIAILFLILFCTTYNQLNEAKIRINQLEQIKKAQNDKIARQEATTTIPTTQTTGQTKTLEEHTEEYLVSYNEALQTYTTILQQIMDNNHVLYPKFIYQELVNVKGQ